MYMSWGSEKMCFGMLAASSPSCPDGRSMGPKVSVTVVPSIVTFVVVWLFNVGTL